MREALVKTYAEEMLCQSLREETIFTITGNSMRPFLKTGDKLFVSVGKSVKLGDIVVTNIEDRFLVRRVLKNQGTKVSVFADTELRNFYLPVEKIVALIERRERAGKIITSRNILWILYSYFILSKYLVKNVFRIAFFFSIRVTQKMLGSAYPAFARKVRAVLFST